MPNLIDTLENLSRAEVVSTFDGAAGFWALNMRQSDRKYAAFHAYIQGGWHLVQPTRMMFGFKGATGAYQRMMNKIYGPSRRDHTGVSDDNLMGDIVESFVDDTVTKTEKEENHINDLAKVLTRLIANNITLKMEKGVWATRELPLLGHLVLCGSGVACDPGKVTALAAMKPRLVSEMRSFLGAAGFLHRFVPEYHALTTELRALDDRTKHGTAELCWNDKAEAAFKALRAALMSTPVLHFPDFTKVFGISVDASGGGLGAVLWQYDEQGVERPIAYGSTGLTDAQKDWGISDREGLGLCWATRRFRNYIASGVCVLVTDHSALLSLRKPKKEFNNDRLYRFALELDQYNLVIAHKPGRYLFMPDILSRAPSETDPLVVQQVIREAWNRTAEITMANPDWTEVMLAQNTAQQRLQHHIRDATVPAQRGMPAQTVAQAVAMIQEDGLQDQEVSTRDLGEEDLLVFEMYDMIAAVSEGTVDCFTETEIKRMDSMVAALSEKLDDCFTIAEVKQAQDGDPFCRALKQYLQSNGESLPSERAMARRVSRLAHVYVLRGGLVTRAVKTKQAMWDDPTQIYLPEGPLRMKTISWAHRELGHAKTLRTYQHIRSLVYWPNMYADVEAHCLLCAECQFFAAKKSSSPVTGHCTAAECGEKYAMDICHLSDFTGDPKLAATNAKAKGTTKQGKKWRGEGYHYALTVVDVYSRFGFVVPLKDIEAITVAEALRTRVLSRGTADEFVFDGGPEFKAEVRAGAKAYCAMIHQTAPLHSKSLGIAERFNRTIQEKIKHFSAQAGQPWSEVYSEALWAYNGAVSESLSHGGRDLTPAEVWFGEKLRLPSAATLKAKAEGNEEPSEYFRQLREKLILVRAAVDEARKRYFTDMEKKSASKHRPLRTFQVGDEVTRYRPTQSKRVNKLVPLHEGPYKVLETLQGGTKYVIKRSGSDEKPVSVHSDDMNMFRRAPPLEDDDQLAEAAAALAAPPAPPAAAPTKKKHQVAEIMDEKGRLQGGEQHQYLIRWEGQRADGGEWQCTWEPATNLDCHKLLMEWEMCSAQERGRRRNRARVITAAAATAMPVAAISHRVRPVKLDLVRAAKVQEETGITVVQQICGILNIDINEIMLVWASPPCESYTWLGFTNESRGNHFRNHQSEEKGPRVPESCHSKEDHEKRMIAQDHDTLTEGITLSMLQDNTQSRVYHYALENPRGMLQNRPFMSSAEWLRETAKLLQHWCNWGGQFHKPSHIWTSLIDWCPGGKSGTGKCDQTCSAGRWEWDKERKWGMKYTHDCHIGGPSEKKGVQEGSQKQQRWKVPGDFLDELLQEVKKEVEEGDRSRKRYVIDLCAGGGSLGPIALNHGCIYVPVDLENSCSDEADEKT
jgi:hypothetical protein